MLSVITIRKIANRVSLLRQPHLKVSNGSYWKSSALFSKSEINVNLKSIEQTGWNWKRYQLWKTVQGPYQTLWGYPKRCYLKLAVTWPRAQYLQVRLISARRRVPLSDEYLSHPALPPFAIITVGHSSRGCSWWERHRDRNVYSWEQLSWHISKNYIFVQQKYLPRFIKQIVPKLDTMSLAADSVDNIHFLDMGTFRRMQKFSCLAK